MTVEATQALACFAATLGYDDIPAPVRESCKDLLLDALACALAGHLGEETPQVAAFVAQLGGSREASVIGAERLSLAGATLLNGYLVTAVTMCDVHRETLTHVTPEVVPPALALAERDGRSGRELLVALAAGFETTTRVGLGWNFAAARARGWHGPGVIGPFGAAAAAGRLLELDSEAMARAFGLAGSQAAGTFAAWGTPTVKFHQCRAALSGLMAALLAEQGFVATREFLTAADGGLFASYSDGGRPEAVTQDLGSRWELERIALRLWPSASTIQGLVTAMFEAVARHGLRADNTRRVRVSVGRSAYELHGIFPRYRGKFEALLSIHYAVAAILHDGALTLAQFEPARYNDPQLARFAAERVEVECDPALGGVQARVTVETASGATVTAHCEHPKGAPENPLARAEIEEKFRTYARGRIAPAAAEEIVRAVARLEELKSARWLMERLRAGARERKSA